MNINKIYKIFLISVFAVSLGVLSGCSEDDNGTGPGDSNDTIVGTWKLKSATLRDTPVGNITISADDMLAQSGTGAVSSVLQINEDGTGATITEYQDGTEETVDGTWSIEGDEIVVVDAGIDATVPFKFNNGDLIITITMEIDLAQDGNPEPIQVDMVYERI
jgi:hypothetical protein